MVEKSSWSKGSDFGVLCLVCNISLPSTVVCKSKEGKEGASPASTL